MPVPFGFLSVDKPAGLTSHDCVNTLRKIFKTKRIGHGGTLDPAVTGVLPIAIGNATRLLQYLPKTKTYSAIIQLGIETTTDDIFGEIIKKKECPKIDKYFLEKILNKFVGKIKQKPPLVSSVHINGERAYKRFRRGEKFDMEERIIEINSIDLLNWDDNFGRLSITIECSSGTYIRSLARDIGNELKSGGCLLEMRRIAALGFKEKDSIPLPKFDPYCQKIPDLINPIDKLSNIKKISIDNNKTISSWRMGKKIKFNQEQVKNPSEEYLANNDEFILLYNNCEVMGIGEILSADTIKPKIVFNAIG